MKRAVFCFSVLLICFVSLVSAGELAIVTENAPPYNYEENGEVTGVSTEILKALFAKLEMEMPPIKVYPWARAYRRASIEENILIYSITRIPEREGLFKWVGTIAPVTVYLYKYKARSDIQLERLEDAKRYIIGAARDDSKLQYLEGQGFTISQVVPNDEVNLKKLKANRIELAPFEELRLAHVVKQMDGIEFSDFDKAYPLEELFLDVSIAFSIKTPDDVVEDFKKALEQLKADGTHEKILNAYLQ